jgi:hypothetical protein
MIAPRGPVLVACVLLACTKPEGLGSGQRLTVSWTGADTATFDARATAERCDPLHLLEIRAISGDTGLGLAVYDSADFGSGGYLIRRPGAADSTPPAAALGVRWFSHTAVQGFQGDSGILTLTRRGDGTLSGRFTATARALNGTGRLALTGSFDGLQVRPAARGCEPPPATPDSTDGVD